MPAQEPQCVGCCHSDQAEDEPNPTQARCPPKQIDDPGDEIGGGEHDGDLEGGGAVLEAVILGHGVAALGLRLEGARHQLLAALALVIGFGLALIACRPVPPFLRPFRKQVPDGRIFGELYVDLHLLGRRLHGGLADGLGLIEGPQVGGFDIVAQGIRLRAPLKQFGDGEEKRQYGDEDGDPLVVSLDTAVAMFVTVRHAPPPKSPTSKSPTSTPPPPNPQLPGRQRPTAKSRLFPTCPYRALILDLPWPYPGPTLALSWPYPRPTLA